MASKAFVNQATTLALAEGFVTMVWEQKYSAMPGNQKFDQLRLDLLDAIRDAWKVMVRTSPQPFTIRDKAKVDRKAKAMRIQIYPDKRFALLQALGLTVNLICFQLDVCSEPKRIAFQRVLDCINQFVRTMDRNNQWDDPDMETQAALMLKIMEGVQ